MAAGVYISFKSQQDIEQNDLALEERDLELHPEHELKELKNIYMLRGLDEKLAEQVAQQLTAHNAINAVLENEKAKFPTGNCAAGHVRCTGQGHWCVLLDSSENHHR